MRNELNISDAARKIILTLVRRLRAVDIVRQPKFEENWKYLAIFAFCEESGSKLSDSILARCAFMIPVGELRTPEEVDTFIAAVPALKEYVATLED